MRPPYPLLGYQFSREELLVFKWFALGVLWVFAAVAFGALLSELF